MYCSWGFLRHGFCVYSLLFGLTMVWLFGNFYYRTYHAAKPSATQPPPTTPDANGNLKHD